MNRRKSFSLKAKNACILIILSLFIVIISSTDSNNNSVNNKIVYRKSIFIESRHLGEILIYDEQEPADVVYAFEKKYKLGYDSRIKLLNDICQAIQCIRSKALLWSTNVVKDDNNGFGDEFVGKFYLYEGVEAADAAHDFIKEHNLTIGYRNSILQQACKFVECTRIEPVIWTKEINIDGNIVKVSIKEGEEPADVIFEQLIPYKLSFESRFRIFDAVKKDNVAFTREFAQIFSKDIVHTNGTIAGKLTFYDDGSQPIDTLFQFTSLHNLTDSFEQLKITVLPKICDFLTCHRMDPVIWKRNLVDENGSPLGNLEIIKDNEPVDVVDEFVRRHNLDKSYRNKILQTICKEIVCKRTVPVVYRKAVQDESGNRIGTFEVFEDEEVVDALVRLKKPGIHFDVAALKKYFLSEACTISGVKCTRDYAILYDRHIKIDNGSTPGRLMITEYDEPADKIYEWCKKYDFADDYFYNLVSTVCNTDGIVCNRNAPLIFGPQKISGPEGEYVGNYEVQLGQEPVDALYQFFAKYNLFKQNWDMASVLNQLCQLPGLIGKCTRRKAIKYYDAKFTFGNMYVGPLLIWEDEEVIDKMYELKLKLNLTLEDQMSTFAKLCQKDEIYCGRNRAILLKLDDINKSDFEHFKNETCLRYYAGWQYMASISQSTIGDKLSKFVAKDRTKEMIEHPSFGLAILLMSFLLTKVTLGRFNRLQKLNAFQKISFYIYTFFVIGYLNQLLIQPIDDVDKAMYLNEGKLPDLIVYEGEEPADALITWGKEASRKHHPLVREEGYWGLLKKICETVTCTRKRAWERIDMGSITQSGQEHKIVYYNPNIDPIARKSCYPILDKKANSCMQRSAIEICSRLYPKIPNCVNDITLHISSEFDKFEERRLDSKNTYTKLGLEMDAPTPELFNNAAYLVRKYGQNISPFARIDNSTSAVYEKWDKNTNYAYAVRDAFHKVKDAESREWNDKPCTPYFGGALCAKTDKDGNMIIEC